MTNSQARNAISTEDIAAIYQKAIDQARHGSKPAISYLRKYVLSEETLQRVLKTPIELPIIVEAHEAGIGTDIP